MRLLPQAIRAGQDVAEALLRPLPEDGVRAYEDRTNTRTGTCAPLSQTAATEAHASHKTSANYTALGFPTDGELD